MPFDKGQGGRPKGSKNKHTDEVRELARGLFTKAYWDAKRRQVAEGKCPPVIEGKLLAYAYGEPKQEHTINHGITVNIGFLQTAPNVIDTTPQPMPIDSARNDTSRLLPGQVDDEAG